MGTEDVREHVIRREVEGHTLSVEIELAEQFPNFFLRFFVAFEK